MKSLLLYAVFTFCLFSTILTIFLACISSPIFLILSFAGSTCVYLSLEKLKEITN